MTTPKKQASIHKDKHGPGHSKFILDQLIRDFSIGLRPEEMYETLEYLLITTMLSESISYIGIKKRDTLITCYMEIKQMIKALDTYNKMANASRQ